MEKLFVILLIFVSCYNFCAAQGSRNSGQCSQVSRTMTHCLSSGPIEINCPTNHYIFVIKAHVFKALGPKNQCPYSHDSTACPVKDIQKMIQTRSACGAKDTCRYSVPYIDDSMCNPGIHEGAAYVHLEYQCQGVFACDHRMGMDARAMSMAAAKYSWTGSHAQIDSVYNALTGHYEDQISESCCVKLPPYTEMVIKPSVFIKNPKQPSGSCNQKLVISESGRSPHWMCTEGSPVTYGCSDKERWFTVKYENYDRSVGTVFAVNVQVDHEKSFTIECGLSAHECQPPPPTTPHPPTSPKPPRSDNIMNIIIGVVLAALVLLLLILLIVCCCCRRSSPDKVIMEEDTPSNSSGFAFVKATVMEGDEFNQVLFLNRNEPLYSGRSLSGYSQ